MRLTTRSLMLIALSMILGMTSGAACWPEPAPQASSSPLQVAADLNPIIVSAGGTAELRAYATGGVSPYTYQWTQTGGPTATIMAATAQASNVQFADAGQYSFVVTVSDDAGTQASSLPVVTTVP